ncbi:type IV pili methyl-accepting chemotaxis transducer N-terminal domain-containing protein [Sphaerotilus montanus]|uniref:type IV pili methyl-accepting chemotaxis transducer N-terminal domain-containing protein n=1 Tax=Sphaerotilus montanus TaxID=522889 RepID=UPI003FA21AC6
MRHTGWPAVCFSWCNDKKHGPHLARPDVINILAIAPAPPDAPTLVADLESNGLLVCCRTQCANLVREAVRHAPDLVIVWEPHPGEDLFEAVRLLEASMPVPVLVFTSDVRAETMETGQAAGTDGWDVNGYAAGRLRPLIQFTVARHRQMRQMREELGDLKRRFEERKLVDRAKGILMTARQVSEDEAFRLLRSASMHAKQRIGQVSQQVIDAAHYADAINRAGRLRMLSQRIVKLYALAAMGVETAGSRALLADSGAQIDQSLQLLDRTLSRPTFGDLIDAVQHTWTQVQAHLGSAPVASRLAAVDQEAEHLLELSDPLTQALENAGLAPTLHVINVSGRQRMLAQRLAKLALLRQGGALSATEPLPVELAPTAEAFERGLTYLKDIPLSTAAIREATAAADLRWQDLLSAVRGGGTPAARVTLAAASEALLELFDRLTREYEQSMQLLMG